MKNSIIYNDVTQNFYNFLFFFYKVDDFLQIDNDVAVCAPISDDVLVEEMLEKQNDNNNEEEETDQFPIPSLS